MRTSKVKHDASILEQMWLCRLPYSVTLTRGHPSYPLRSQSSKTAESRYDLMSVLRVKMEGSRIVFAAEGSPGSSFQGCS